ncbi:MAG: hypothetical protein IH908_13390 [Proteobacteria bacterium]|nr:hypothetical protein [Pseudomonadota bacterium]
MDTCVKKRHLVEITLLLVTALSVAAQTPAEPPRTPWGAPDLNGVWKFAVATPIERPEEFTEKTHFSEEEAATYLDGAYARLEGLVAFFDGGEDKFVGVEPWIPIDLPLTDDLRTSLIYLPDNGRIPALTEAAQARQEAERKLSLSPPTGPEDRPLTERCLTGFVTGPPLTTVLDYNSNIQIFQSEDTVVILNEMVNDSRIVPLDGRPHLPENVRQWLGNSRGHWEGDTLVVETRNFTDKTTFNGSGMNMHLTERFTPVSKDVIEYDFRIEDPDSFTTPWAARSPMRRIDQPIYEYACHEDNRSMVFMLLGARAQEAQAE